MEKRFIKSFVAIVAAALMIMMFSACSNQTQTAQPTATDQVIGIINGSKNGVNTATLMKKTGFDQRKIWSIINRASKAGKIKRAGKGIYIGA